MRLDDDFELVHGARYWHALRREAGGRGSAFPLDPPAVTVAVVSLRVEERWWPADGGGDHPAFVAGCGAVNTDASMVMFEWLTVSRSIEEFLCRRERHRAVEHLMRAGLVYATAIGKRPVIINGTRGIRQMAQRIGLASGTSFEVLMGEMP